MSTAVHTGQGLELASCAGEAYRYLTIYQQGRYRIVVVQDK
jgi:hypothetical protein